MALFQSKAVTELEKLRNKELPRLDSRIRETEQQLATLRNVSGDALLDQVLSENGSSERSRTRQRVRQLDDELNDLRIARGALVGRIQAAQRAVAHEKAEKIREEANTLQAELDAHNAETARLKVLLETHAGEPYFPTPGWDLDYLRGQKVEDLPLPPATRMRMRIAELRAQADKIETLEPAQEVNVVPIQPMGGCWLGGPVPEVRTSEPVPMIEPRRGWYQAG